MPGTLIGSIGFVYYGPQGSSNSVGRALHQGTGTGSKAGLPAPFPPSPDYQSLCYIRWNWIISKGNPSSDALWVNERCLTFHHDQDVCDKDDPCNSSDNMHLFWTEWDFFDGSVK